MKLYHGTSIAGLRKILREGIKPRNVKHKGNWEKFPSKPGYVYLTDAYALYFAIQAMEDGDTKYAVVEIDASLLDESRLCPDEDFIGQALAHQKVDTMERATKACDPMEYQHHWLDSLTKLGNCSYRGRVPVSAITRVAIINTKGHEDAVFLSMLAMDPSISLLNYRLLGEKYRSLIGYVFDGTDLHDPMFEAASASAALDENLPQELKDMLSGPQRQREMLRNLRPHVVQVLKPDQALRMYPKDIVVTGTTGLGEATETFLSYEPGGTQ